MQNSLRRTLLSLAVAVSLPSPARALEGAASLASFRFASGESLAVLRIHCGIKFIDLALVKIPGVPAQRVLVV